MRQSTLTLIRHGQSIWNLQNRFTGWIDVSLSPQGLQEARQAGERLADQRFDVAYASTLIRSQETLYEILRLNRRCSGYRRIHEGDSAWYEHFKPGPEDQDTLLIHFAEELNERFYGDLQGLNKDQARQEFGAEQVHIWRRSYDTPPPNGESLAATAARVIPFFKDRLVPILQEGRNLLIAAHGNSLRALIMHLENMTPEQILAYELATGVPIQYRLDGALNILEKKVLD
ncbi:2,3-bisphosphoglycerate-dependent phosphoglycerate mutase [Methylomarinovum caldicuralii]|uniref:2,3-bisphosphoglycerate-dependent phosphoglycerate mutase n=1 Tax=Methylomarinovum caldicuralii TaxID=438856 RepID=A0AAU9CCB4_9GAMM|nr:2,3-bisphosphoglycerate-dependent phosphoglycerate mutase [Methylomarinovum caldicuralii]BCX82204.1 2,3-bisphosphoglycerate-dependent phosphoglycerate mutase [Methylomarinovum caldicuralii]